MDGHFNSRLGTRSGSFEVKQVDTGEGAGHLIAGFVVGGKFYAGDLHTDYGTLHAEVASENGVSQDRLLLHPAGTGHEGSREPRRPRRGTA